MAAPQASSRLELLQARFQQKQLQEKEQKLLQLYDQQQQRAYQVVQRGSAGSNGSSHGTSISQHTVTRTSTSNHTTSTSQGGKVRQMFDERRQTTVKGIDRSYPLEPLENKPRKQTNGNGVQKNGNLTVNRQSVTVKRVARADVNSNLNGGKPVVSYHEEVTRESYGPSGPHNVDDDEFGNENHIAQYANGKHRDETQIEEVLDEDTIQRNRMMAKLHLMQYDETLKHRVKNDLESEEFPEDFMVDVPDKLPKQTVARKLSQAEARLERFKNANARRSNSLTKNTNSIAVSKKRSEPMFPAKSTSRGNEIVKARTQKVLNKGSSAGKESPRSGKSSASPTALNYAEEISTSSDSEKYMKRRSGTPKFFCEESEKSTTTYAIDSKTTGKLSPEFSKDRIRRSNSPKYFCKESDKSATTYAIDSKITGKLSPDFSKNTVKRCESPKFFCRESEKSATTYTIDSKTPGKLTPDVSKDRIRRSDSPKYFCKESEKFATTYTIDSKTSGKLSPDFSRDSIKRSESPKFFCKESEKSATTYAIGSKTPGKLIPDFSKDRIRRSDSPKYFCRESEKSATTYAIDSKTSGKLSPDFSRDRIKRSESPKFFCKESEKSATTYAIDSKSAGKLASDFSKDVERRSESPVYAIDSQTRGKLSPDFSRDRIKRSESPKYFCKESEKSATTYAIDSKLETLSPDFTKNIKRTEKSKQSIVSGTDTVDRNFKSPSQKISRTSTPDNLKSVVTERKKIGSETASKSIRRGSSDILEKIRKTRNTSPQYSHHECKKSALTKNTNTKDNKFVSKSPAKMTDKHSNYLKHEKSIVRATTKSPDQDKKILRKSNTSPQFYSSDSERSASILFVTPETITKTPTKTEQDSRFYTNEITESKRKMSEDNPDDSSKYSIRNSVSRFFSKQCEKASKNMDIATRTNLQSPSINKSPNLSRSTSPVSLKDMKASGPTGKSSQFHPKEVEKPSVTTPNKSNSRSPSPRSQKMDNRKSPDFFCYETKESATTVSLKPKSIPDSTNKRTKCPETFQGKSTRECLVRSGDTKDIVSRSRSPSKSPENFIRSKDVGAGRRASAVVLRSTRLIRDIIKGQKNRNEDYRSEVAAKELRRSSVASENADGISGRSGKGEAAELGANKKVDKRPRTPIRTRELLTPESSPKSSTSVEVDAEIQEITMPDQYIKQEELRSTYSKSSGKAARNKTETNNLFTYSVRKPGRKRGSLLRSNVFEPMKAKRGQEHNGVNLKDITSYSTSPSPTNEGSIASKRGIRGNMAGRQNNKKETLGFRRQTPSPVHTKGKTKSLKEAIAGKTARQAQSLRSMELVRRAMKGSSCNEEASDEIVRACEREIDRSSGASISTENTLSKSVKRERSWMKDYERTDSVESALRRFDSIGAASVQSVSELDKESTEKTVEESGGTISLKALDQNVNVPEPSGASLRNRSPESCRETARIQELRGQKKFARARDSMEIARIAMRSKSPGCKRKLFRDDSTERTGSPRSKCGGSMRTVESLSPRNKNEMLGSGRITLKSLGAGSCKKSAKSDETSTGDSDRSLAVKQLRSIEDIRKSIDGESPLSRPAIANDATGRSGKVRSGNFENRVECRKGKRSECDGRKNDGSVKCATRFLRVAKSPSPDSTKTMEPSSKTRRNIPSSPSKSPDTAARRPSTELKAQETKSTKRPVPMKGTEPIGNRKTTTTTTTRKSTDVVDGAILENGLHLRDQTAETKYDNDSPTTKKSDAFVIDFDEQPPKENDAPLPRKPLLRKQSTEKQTPSPQSARPPSSVSSISSGGSMQGQTSVSRGRMASKAKTPISGTMSARGSSKGGGNTCNTDNLVPCKICGRRFAQDRVSLHEQICAKTKQKKRKQFDAMTYRVRGTELEPFVKKGLSKKQTEKSKQQPEMKTNWRRKHEDFINAIRSAKQVQAHLAAGGKLSDLPPPPVSDTSDYIQCPHCGRKFNQAAAERHIPKCEHMLHNKPAHSRPPRPRR